MTESSWIQDSTLAQRTTHIESSAKGDASARITSHPGSSWTESAQSIVSKTTKDGSGRATPSEIADSSTSSPKHTEKTRSAAPTPTLDREEAYPPARGWVYMIQEGRPSKKKEEANTPGKTNQAEIQKASKSNDVQGRSDGELPKN